LAYESSALPLSYSGNGVGTEDDGRDNILGSVKRAADTTPGGSPSASEESGRLSGDTVDSRNPGSVAADAPRLTLAKPQGSEPAHVGCYEFSNRSWGRG
jgi:hypothetical protein